MKLSVAILSCLCLAACASHPAGSQTTSRADMCNGDDVEHLLMPPGLYETTTRSQTDPVGISVPLLRVLDLEGALGKPSYRIMRDGSYIADYKAISNSSCPNHVTIIGTRRKTAALPFPVPGGPWRILGNDVRWFWSGNEQPEICTEAVTLKSPGGRSATYKIIVDGSDRNIEKHLPHIGW